MFIQRMVEVKGGGFVGDTLKTQARELAQDGLFVQRLFHWRIAITKPVPYSMNPQHGRQRVGRTTAFILGVMRLDQGNQAMPRYNPIHLEQEQIFAGLLRSRHRRRPSAASENSVGAFGYFTKIRKSFSAFPYKIVAKLTNICGYSPAQARKGYSIFSLVCAAGPVKCGLRREAPPATNLASASRDSTGRLNKT